MGVRQKFLKHRTYRKELITRQDANILGVAEGSQKSGREKKMQLGFGTGEQTMSREKQIKEMSKITKVHCELDNQCGSCHWETCNECLAEVLYTAGYRKKEWISVDERLPERNGRYLTHCNIEGQSLVCILHYCKVGGFNEGTVTHWMPLPSAPKMKGGAE